MKNVSIFIGSVLLLCACSTPRYNYKFSYYDYNSRRKASQPAPAAPVVVAGQSELPSLPVIPAEDVPESPLILQSEPIASVSQDPVTANPGFTVEKAAFEKKYKEMSKSERREFRKSLKTEVKNLIKAKKNGDSVDEVKVMDHDLKLAIIFGAVALTLSFFGGVNSVFWVLSVVSLVVAVVFFIKWIAEQ